MLPYPFSPNAQIQSVVEVASPLVWRGLREPKVDGLLGAVAAVIDPNTFEVQRDSEGEFVLFEPWLYYIKSQDWDGERMPYRGGWSQPIRVPMQPKHLTEQMSSNDFRGRKPPRQNLLKAINITQAMVQAYQRDPTQFATEALAANELAGYDGQPTFHNNHTDIQGNAGKSNIGKINVDFAVRAQINKPSILEIYGEILKIRHRMVRNQVGIVRFQKADVIRKLTVIVRSEETFLAFDSLNRREKLTIDQENDLQGTLDIVEDTEFEAFGLDPNTYDAIAGADPGEPSPRPFALSTVRPPLGIEAVDRHFETKTVVFGTDYDLAMGPWYWQGAFRVEP